MAGVAVKPEFHQEKVLVSQAAIRLYPLDPTSNVVPALPADTVPLNGPWPTGWVAIGATTEGVNLNFSRSTESIRIEESQVAIDERTTELTFTVGTTLAESSLETMKLAFGGGTITTTPATTSAPGRKQLKISQELDRFALGGEGKNEYGKPRRFLIPIVLSVADAEVAFRRAAAPQTYAVSFKSLVDVDQCDFVDIISDKLAA